MRWIARSVAHNLIGLARFLALLTKAFCPHLRQPVSCPQQHQPDWSSLTRDKMESEFEAMIGPSVELVGDLELLFCPRCHQLVAQTRRTKQGTEVWVNGKRTITVGDNVIVSKDGKESRGFPLSCPNGHSVRVN